MSSQIALNDYMKNDYNNTSPSKRPGTVITRGNDKNRKNESDIKSIFEDQRIKVNYRNNNYNKNSTINSNLSASKNNNFRSAKLRQSQSRK